MESRSRLGVGWDPEGFTLPQHFSGEGKQLTLVLVADGHGVCLCVCVYTYIYTHLLRSARHPWCMLLGKRHKIICFVLLNYVSLQRNHGLAPGG